MIAAVAERKDQKRDIKENLDAIAENVMAGLTDFQQETVKRAAYLYAHGEKRILVADEVGLGKTMVAKGIIAQVARLQKSAGDDLVKVVYICSNTTIADQNLKKLSIAEGIRPDLALDSRLSMQHLQVFTQEAKARASGQYIQLIPLTPETSFSISAGEGNVRERALMYAVLRNLPELRPIEDKLELLMQCYADKGWVKEKPNMEEAVQNATGITGNSYLSDILPVVEAKLKKPGKEGSSSLFDELVAVCNEIQKPQPMVEKEESKRRTSLLGRLRMLFAQISVDRLQPDLIILDEFQRFPTLLNQKEDSEFGLLLNRFFHANDTRVLLLSATPFKLYSTSEELEEEGDLPYQEFYNVMDFLRDSEKEKDDFRTIWKNYSHELQESARPGGTVLKMQSVLAVKQKAENALYQNICRTERLAETAAAELLMDLSENQDLAVTAADIRSCVQMQELWRQMKKNGSIPLDYVKSAPWLLSFMQNYKLKEEVQKYFQAHPDRQDLLNRDTFWIPRETIRRYGELPVQNARLQALMDRVTDARTVKMLWIPPSCPWYPLEGIYQDAGPVTKTLVFSAWEMVPRMVSSLVSYQAERETVGQEPGAVYDNYSASDRPMDYKIDTNGKPERMLLFALLYPSRFLTKLYCPEDGLNRRCSLAELREELRDRIAERNCPKIISRP